MGLINLVRSTKIGSILFSFVCIRVLSRTVNEITNNKKTNEDKHRFGSHIFIIIVAGNDILKIFSSIETTSCMFLCLIQLGTDGKKFSSCVLGSKMATLTYLKAKSEATTFVKTFIWTNDQFECQQIVWVRKFCGASLGQV